MQVLARRETWDGWGRTADFLALSCFISRCRSGVLHPKVHLTLVIGLDVRRDDEWAVPGARMGRGEGMGCVWGGEPAPGQREVEGRGGAFWYEVPH